MSSITERMRKLLNLPEEQEATGSESEQQILSALALAATHMGIDMDDGDAVDKFIADVKMAATKEKSKLKSLLRRYTPAKAKAAAKATLKNA